MLQVWFLYKLLEALIGLACVTYHCLGFRTTEPLPHVLIFCGTYFGFTLISLWGAIALSLGAAPPALTEFISNFLATVFYGVSSVLSMQYAEQDFHLMYVLDYEEVRHEFFFYSRAQSICALTAAALHMTHAALAFEMAQLPQSATESDSEEVEERRSSDVSSEARIFFLGKVVEKKLCQKSEWFDALCRRRSPAVSVLSFMNRNEQERSSVVCGAIRKIRRRWKESAGRMHDGLSAVIEKPNPLFSNVVDENDKRPQQLSDVIKLREESELTMKGQTSAALKKSSSNRSFVSFSESTHSSLAKSYSDLESPRLKRALPLRSASTSALQSRHSGSLTTLAGSLTSVEPLADPSDASTIVPLKDLTPKPSEESLKKPSTGPKS